MRQLHHAGETVQVDYAGDTVALIDDGTARAAQIFVACLPWSRASGRRRAAKHGITRHIALNLLSRAKPTISINAAVAQAKTSITWKLSSAWKKGPHSTAPKISPGPYEAASGWAKRPKPTFRGPLGRVHPMSKPLVAIRKRSSSAPAFISWSPKPPGDRRLTRLSRYLYVNKLTKSCCRMKCSSSI
jgi:hypothetical protein